LITIINFFKTLLEYDFMQHAFIAGTIAAIVAGIVGYFVVIRGLAFAGHALGHIGFAGAAGAGLIGLSPLSGQLILTVFASAAMGSFGERIYKRDVAIGTVLAFSLGLGVLFLYFYKAYAARAMSILFGDLLSVSNHLIYLMLIFSLPTLLVLASIARPLLFASLEPELAQAKGVSLNFISILFLIIVAVAVTIASQIVGILLVFTLLIGPAASAINWSRSFWSGILLTILIAVGIVWAGIVLTYATDWPAVFWISTLSLGFYLMSKVSNYS
jgi:zinc/manganese transport system permease protein